jgi:SAM-dependent methyltransferase
MLAQAISSWQGIGMAEHITWEQAVQWLRDQPTQTELVRACYFDDPLPAAAERFANGAEWQATRRLLPAPSGKALDLGAGRGISSYALARDGWDVTALEPDPSALVGSGAIRSLAQSAQLPINVIEDWGEKLPSPDAAFDVVHARQVLHHARDLQQLIREVARVLKPGGWFIATREHVISRREDLPAFLASHPLHHLYGGENAFLLDEYENAITASGLTLARAIAPLEDVINYFPTTDAQRRYALLHTLKTRYGVRGIAPLLHEAHPLGRWLLAQMAAHLAQSDNTPGRLYTFLAKKDIRA